MSISQTYIRNVSFEDFDPNVGSDKQPVWGIYDGSKFRTYAQRGHVMNAFNQAWQGKLYRFEDGSWVEVAVKNKYKPPTVCDQCGVSTMEYPDHYDFRTRTYVTDTSAGRTVNDGAYEWNRRNGKIIEPLTLRFLCRGCR